MTLIVPTFKCPYCDKETSAQMDMSGDVPTGVLQLCDCPEFRAEWERDHRAKMELRKKAQQQRGGARSNSIIHVGRTPQPTGKQRYRSR